jgi:hypothetical protein
MMVHPSLATKKNKKNSSRTEQLQPEEKGEVPLQSNINSNPLLLPVNRYGVMQSLLFHP